MCKEVKEENEGQSAPLDKGPKAKTTLECWNGKINASIMIRSEEEKYGTWWGCRDR